MNRVSRQTPASKRTKKRSYWLPILAVLLAAAGVLGYFLWTQRAAAAAQAGSATADASTKTSQVRRGSIILSASASGTLIAGQERALGFSVAGTVAEISVQVGDTVSAGQALAQLAEMDDLRADLVSAEQDLLVAQQDLDSLKKNAALNLANAQLALISAEQAVESAKSKLVQEGWARCDAATTEAYYGQYVRAVEHLESLGDGGGSQDYYLNIILPARNTVAKTKATYEYCAGYTRQEIDAAQASHTLAEVNLEQARANLQNLQENDGLDPLALASAENTVANAQFSLDQARKKLAGATIIAPFAGTVLEVEGEVGDTAGTNGFITIADLAHPRVEFSVDETDMAMIALGAQATVRFDAVPDRIFHGTVIRINPALETVSGYQVLRGLIELEMSGVQASLPKGLNGSVEVTKASAKNVLLVPLQAVRDLGDGSYAVFVVAEDGRPRMRVVEVGLMDLTSAEILSGLEQGEVVTTGIEEAAQ